MKANAAGFGEVFLFHGAFKTKTAAVRKERRIPGSFIRHSRGRYFVLTQKNPPEKTGPGVIIYGRVLRIEAQKTQPHVCDDECKEYRHCYAHEFKAQVVMYGLPNGDLLIRAK